MPLPFSPGPIASEKRHGVERFQTGMIMMGQHGKRGASGPRGAQGAQGSVGATGRRGHIGKPGHKGPEGLRGPLHQDDILDMVMTHFDDVYEQLGIQMKQIAHLQYQLNKVSAAGSRLTKR
jgi:hypothetical protein